MNQHPDTLAASENSAMIEEDRFDRVVCPKCERLLFFACIIGFIGGTLIEIKCPRCKGTVEWPVPAARLKNK